MRTKTEKTLAIVGLGYVGLPLALLAERRGYRVIGIDTDPRKVDLITKRQAPFSDEKVQKELRDSRIEATVDFSFVGEAAVVVICVPTPVDESNLPDLTSITRACEGIAAHMKRGQLVVLESTVNPGVSDRLVIPVLERQSGLRSGIDFNVAHCPERINPGDTRYSVENISRVVGADSPQGLARAMAFYASLITAPLKAMKSLREAEAVKVVENAFRDVNIAFVNELAMSFSKVGIDVVNVIEGAATKPFSFMPHFPGCGVGGHCIPVDPYYMIEYGKKNGFEHRFLSLAREINNSMPAFTVSQVVRGLSDLDVPVAGTKVALLGLAYKPEVDDCRESPSFEIARFLGEAGFRVATFDPFVPARSSAATLDEALEGARAVVLATAHRALTALTPEVFVRHGVKLVVDGRNALQKDAFVSAGLSYHGIGR